MNSGHLQSVPQYAGKPIAYAKEPIRLSQREHTHIESELSSLLKLVEEFTTDTLKDPTLLRQLGLPEKLNPQPTPLGLHIPVARFDFLYSQGKIQVLELNTDGTSGFNISEWVAQEAKIKDNENPNFNLSVKLLKGLLEHDPRAQEVALLDFRDVKTSWEQYDLARRWSTLIKCHRATPDIRSWGQNSLIYRRALSWHLRAYASVAKPFLEDWNDKKIKVIGGWSSDVGMSKAWPAFINTAICPETKIVSRALLKTLIDEKDDWILKGALSFSGGSIIRGCDASIARWPSALDKVLNETESGRTWVAQKHVEIPLYESKPLELGMYFINGKPSGYLARWGHNSVIDETSTEYIRPVQITS